jgi:hypothetical protein
MHAMIRKYRGMRSTEETMRCVGTHSFETLSAALEKLNYPID